MLRRDVERTIRQNNFLQHDPRKDPSLWARFVGQQSDIVAYTGTAWKTSTIFSKRIIMELRGSRLPTATPCELRSCLEKFIFSGDELTHVRRICPVERKGKDSRYAKIFIRQSTSWCLTRRRITRIPSPRSLDDALDATKPL